MAYYAEILHDRDSGIQDTAPVVAGLESLTEITGYDIVITRDSRQIKIARTEDETLRMEKVRLQ